MKKLAVLLLFIGLVPCMPVFFFFYTLAEAQTLTEAR